VSRYDGQYEHVFESTTAGVAIQAPQVRFLMCAVYCYLMFFNTRFMYCSWISILLLLEVGLNCSLELVCLSSDLNQPEPILDQLATAKVTMLK